MTNSILDLMKSAKINCMCTGDSFEETGFICWPSRDRVSISPRSCVNFVRSAQAEIVCQFHQMFVGVQLIFEKSSAMWRIIRKEEIKEIAQRPEAKGAKTELAAGQIRSRSTGVYDVHRRGPVDRAVDRGLRTVD